MVLLFLDFDGCMHGKATPRFCRLPLLESLLREPACQHVRVVIASTWREAYTLGELLRIFSPDIQLRVIGVTPFISDKATRYEEICAFLEAYPGKPWCALDDDNRGFPTHLRNVVFTDPAVGLSASDVDKLRALLLA